MTAFSFYSMFLRRHFVSLIPGLDPLLKYRIFSEMSSRLFFFFFYKGRQRPRKGRKEISHAQMRAALQKTYANPESLKDKAQGKCLICR